MSYKEVQVPSAKIREIYEPLLKELEGMLEQSKIKFEENMKLKKENKRKEDEAVLKLGAEYRYYSGSWFVSIDDHYLYENPVIKAITMCNTMLNAASLNETVVMTESQIKEMNRWAEILEFCKDWLTEAPYLDTTHQDELERRKKIEASKGQNKTEEKEHPKVTLIQYTTVEPIPESKEVPVIVWVLLSAIATAALFCFI